jgi:DedD protein
MAEGVEMQEESANIMDETIKDRTVTRIATISIVAVGLLGLWVIGGALHSRSSPDAVPPPPPTSSPLPTSTPPPLAAERADQSPPSMAASGSIGKDAADHQADIVHITSEPPVVPAGSNQSLTPATDSAKVFVSQPVIPAKNRSGAQHFGVQLGVFNTVANAENLRQKMQAQGVPVVVEARVHVGPFATRAEADEARAKLKALGIEDSVLVILK